MPTPTETLRKIFKDIANAIRGKDGTTEATDKIHPEDYANRIQAIQTGPDITDATAQASDIRSGETAYISSGKVTGSMPAAGSISGQLGVTGGANWSTSNPNRGSGTVSITGVSQTPGYTDGFSNGSLTITVPANRLLKGRTVTPTTSDQTIANAEDIAYGAIKVAGDPDLKAENIKSGVSIFGVTGTISAGTDTSDATATSIDIVSGKSAYSADGKIYGEIPYIPSGGTKLLSSPVVSQDGSELVVKNKIEESTGLAFRYSSYVQISMSLFAFGNATAADVAAGKTFTSSAGFKVTGTGSAGTDTSDATATASDIAYGETAYVNGQKISGDVFAVASGSVHRRFNQITVGPVSNGNIYVQGLIYYTDGVLLRNGSFVLMEIPPSNFGNATAADVAAGKTFTSSAGLNVRGTFDIHQKVSLTVTNGLPVAFRVDRYVADNTGGAATYSVDPGTSKVILIERYGIAAGYALSVFDGTGYFPYIFRLGANSGCHICEFYRSDVRISSDADLSGIVIQPINGVTSCSVVIEPLPMP